MSDQRGRGFWAQWNPFGSMSPRKAARPRRNHRPSPTNSLAVAAEIELLEARALLSSASPLSGIVAEPTVMQTTKPHAASGPSGMTPSQLQTAYGFNKLSFQNGANGTGQTIAIVDAYHDPTIQSDLQAFDRAFGLADPPSLTVMSQTGSTTILPPVDPTGGWEVEEALDVEWAHALAPGAKIVLVEANSARYSDLMTAVAKAASLPGVSVVSMSWGGDEFSGETAYDSMFLTPSGHQGVTFVASTGDSGQPGGYPAYSPNVLAVGGTTLRVDSSGNYISETAWADSGGGISQYESQPSYQRGIVTQTTTKRAIPDVSFDADPNSGVAVYNSYKSSNPWYQVGGTSLSAPSWGAIIAIADQARAQNGLASLDGASQTLPMLYHLNQTTPSAFHDITTGNNGFAATAGYDLVTGLGSPVVNVLVPGLAGTATTANSRLAFTNSPGTATAGQSLGTVTVAIQNQNGQTVTTDNSTVTISIANGPGGFTGSSTVSVKAVNGIATFTNLVLNTAGSYQITASDGSYVAATTSSFVVNPSQANKLVFVQPPATGTANQNLSVITVAVEDQFGNVVTNNSSTVTMTLASGPAGFVSGSITSMAAVNGIATFNKLILGTAGGYTLKATDGSLASATSASFTVNAATPVGGSLVLTNRLLSTSSVELDWNSVSGAQGYTVFWSDGIHKYTLGTVRSTIHSVVVTGLVPGNNYQFQIEAYKGSQVLADSNWITVNSASFSRRTTGMIFAAFIDNKKHSNDA